MKILLSLFFLLFISFKALPQSNDISVEIDQSMLNKLVKSLGPISGEEEYTITFIKGTYRWTLMNTRISLTPGKAVFNTDVKVDVGGFDYVDDVEGLISVNYDEKNNKLLLKLETAVFEIYTKILGEKITIKKIELANYLKDPFVFDGPISYQTSMPFTMPDKTVKNIDAKIKNCKINIVHRKIIMTALVDFMESVKK